MEKLAGGVLLILLCAGLIWAQTEKKAATKGPVTTVEAMKQLERDWTAASKAGDADKLDAIIADDWRDIPADGKILSKRAYIEAYKSGKSKIESFDFGSIDVKVVGSVAIVQGSDMEKSSDEGKDTSGRYVWMDVFVNRGGKWMALRSQSAMMK